MAEIIDQNQKSKKVKKGDPDLTPQDDEEEVLATDNTKDSGDIHAILRALRQDEVVGLSQSSHNRHTIFTTADNYLSLISLETGRYIKFVINTWVGVTGTVLFGGLGPFDLFSILFFATGGTVVLFFVLIFCLAVHFPAFVRLYYRWSDKYGGGLGLVNSGNPNLFHSLTQEQCDAAKEALSEDISDSQDNDKQRFFSLDRAKLLLQFASVIYEHENDAIRSAVTIAAKRKPISFQPLLGGASSELATSVAGSLNKIGGLVSQVFDDETSDKVSKALDSKSDAKIREFCARFDLDFEPISELNNTASAFSGLFWDPKSNWIVVAFKGTAPIEFGEWLSDLNTKMVPVGAYIDGFKRVHKGFKERLYPEDVSDMGQVRPYDTISAGIKALAKHLRKTNNLDKNINVWFTGHSLGCATATLVYSRFLMRHKDMGKYSNLRDAYLFAAPIVCDRDTVEVFNAKMMADKKRPKTMWRITSNGDMVATCLPELGDYTSINVSPNNAFAFAHLGTEIKMRDDPYASHVVGNHIAYGAKVAITSKFTRDQLIQQRAAHLAQPGEQKREMLGVMAQSIPLLGRVAAHATIFYWDQLDRVAVGKCQWAAN